MRFNFTNLGYIDSGSLELGDLTVICGPNNLGKSYVSHAIHGLLLETTRFDDFIVPEDCGYKLLQDGRISIDLSEQSNHLPKYIEAISSKFTKELPSFFSVDAGFFKNSNVAISSEGLSFDFIRAVSNTLSLGAGGYYNITYNKAKDSAQLDIIYMKTKDELPHLHQDILKSFIKQIVRHCLFAPIFSTSFPITSERTGIAIFQKQLDYTLSSVLGSSGSIEPNKALNNSNSIIFTYTRPITYNIDLIRSFKDISSSQKSFITNDQQYQGVLNSLYDLMKGTCKVIDDRLVYIANLDETREPVVVPIHMASSSIKSMALIELYIRYIARKNDLLIIDEPEQNLYPSNQRKMAGLIARLVNAGVKVIITTHSDFIIRELNNRLMLSLKVKDKEGIMEEYGIGNEEILQTKQVKAYVVQEDHTLATAEFNDYGINLSSFDKVIIEASDLNEELYYSIEE